MLHQHWQRSMPYMARISIGNLRPLYLTVAWELFAGSSRGGIYSETTSPQQTWTAGMTKGVPPRELIQQLKRNRSAPALDDAADEAAGISGAPSDHPSQEPPPVGDASEMGRSSSNKVVRLTTALSTLTT